MLVPEHAASGSSDETLPNCDIFTAETRRCGEVDENLTTEARRHGEGCRSSDSPDHPITCDFPITRSLSLCRTLLATLREIFDESAYDRFLLRNNAARSIASYRAFTRERDASMQRKPRCC
jgi:hypothetical protein